METKDYNKEFEMKYKLWYITFVISFLIGLSLGYNTKKPDIKQDCNHLKVNKQLIWVDSIFNSKEPIIKIFDNGWCLTYEPCGYKSKNNKK